MIVIKFWSKVRLVFFYYFSKYCAFTTTPQLLTSYLTPINSYFIAWTLIYYLLSCVVFYDKDTIWKSLNIFSSSFLTQSWRNDYEGHGAIFFPAKKKFIVIFYFAIFIVIPYFAILVSWSSSLQSFQFLIYIQIRLPCILNINLENILIHLSILV